MNKKIILKTGLLLLIIGIAYMSGYYSTIKRKGEEASDAVKKGTNKPDSGECIVEEAESPEEAKSNYEYDILPEDTVVITKYLGDQTLVFVPKMLDGKAVSTIGVGAFQGNSSIEQIVLPQGIEVIESQAFAYCSNLQYVVMGTGLKSIGQDAFSHCSSLAELRLPEELTMIELCIGAYCPNLEKVVIPQSMEEISPSAFMGCDKLYLIYGSNSCAENYAQRKGLVYVDLKRIEEEGDIVW